MKYKLTIYDTDGSITYESNSADKIIKQIESARTNEEEPEVEVEKSHTRPMTPYEHCRNAVYATGNRWAIENFHATHG